MNKPDNKCAIIAEYENTKDIPEQDRCTEYVDAFGMYMFRLEASSKLINERYAAAKASGEGRAFADGKRITAVFRKTLVGNIQDSAKFSLSQEEEMLQTFYTTSATEKKLGVCIGEEVHFLLRQGNGKNVPPEMISLPFGVYETRYMERMDELRSRWYKKLVALDYATHCNDMKMVLEANGSYRERKQQEFHFAKEIRRRMRTCDKVFFDEHMEGYDFREVDLQRAIFINCSLANSNFAHCNLENAFFFRCDLQGCDWYNAVLNGCMAYYGGELVYLNDFSRKENN